MRLLKRLLRGRHEQRRRHLESCEECRLQQRRERQYLERLRSSAVPAASDGLTARLLARTEVLARSEQAAPRGSAPRPEAFHGLRPVLRAGALAAGGAAAAAALLGGSAYLMGGSPAAPEEGTPAPVFLERDLAASGTAAVEPGAGTPAGWSLAGEPDFTPAGSLTAAQLAALRSEGWACPELRELGYHLVWARAGVLAGGDLVELHLTDGRNFATVLEQHGVSGQRGVTGPAPVNLLTGRPATSDGFSTMTVPSGDPLEGSAAAAGTGILWVNHDSPFAAIYESGDATFTYVTDQDAEQAYDGVAALARAPQTDSGDGTRTDAGHDFTARIQRGLGRILELLAP